jgi:hypothetical protein
MCVVVNYKNSNIFLFYLLIVLREGLISLSDEFVNTSNAVFLTESEDNERLLVQLFRSNSGVILERGYACVGEFADNEFGDFVGEIQNSVDINWDCVLLLKMRELDVKRKWLFDVLNDEEAQKRKLADEAFEFDSYFDKIKDTPYVKDYIEGPGEQKTAGGLQTPISNEVLFKWLDDRFNIFISTLKDTELATTHGLVTVQNVKQICYSIFVGLSDQILIKKYADRFVLERFGLKKKRGRPFKVLKKALLGNNNAALKRKRGRPLKTTLGRSNEMQNYLTSKFDVEAYSLVSMVIDFFSKKRFLKNNKTN